jgi:5-methylcytosine-specific restriction endonuclease McrA
MRCYVLDLRDNRLFHTADGSIDADALDGLMEHQQFLCAICGEIPPGLPSFDHIIPLRHGGTHSITNLQMTCWPCNEQKRDKLPLHVSTNRTILEDRYFPRALESVFGLRRGDDPPTISPYW